VIAVKLLTVLPIGSLFALVSAKSHAIFRSFLPILLALPGFAEPIQIDDFCQVAPRGNVTLAGDYNLAPYSPERR
jgi:hypothetical protein